ncbi:cell division regulator GpsB [Sporosarcina sp. ACRSM]|uniref:cell division regulator GpsB n=1 Tax=Sporosarcina sp. ACRSM TaxID=2918216 RepID=UPI001EF4C286|nr:cell division regulator GpsB [Sporosarcina sp. ACRSM]MCG7333844.1 cell division regulator GpsB [Sporosarcina sp. ACRSM]
MDIKLDSKKILEKEFKTGLRGYNQEEVDLFLDDVIQDYETFKKTIAELRNENAKLQEELTAAQRRPAAGSAGTTNFDILKRISNLEKHVFGSKLFDQE